MWKSLGVNGSSLVLRGLQGRRIQALRREGRRKGREFLEKLPMDEFFLMVTSSMVKRFKKPLRLLEEE